MIKRIQAENIPDLFSGKKTKRYYSDIEEFLKSGFECCEHILEDGDKSYLAALGLRYVSKKVFAPIYVIERNGRVFLLKKEAHDGG